MNHRPTPKGRRIGRALCLLAAPMLLSSCATVTGLATGAFTGFVDLPNELIQINRLAPDASGTWVVAIATAPIGFAFGPAFGLVKGISLDVNAACGNVARSDAFGTYDRVSIWRPYTFDWDSKR